MLSLHFASLVIVVALGDEGRASLWIANNLGVIRSAGQGLTLLDVRLLSVRSRLTIGAELPAQAAKFAAILSLLQCAGRTEFS
jgi:hypothetical protein